MAKILIIDDDPVFCAQMTIYLKRLGHEAQALGSLGQGLAAVAQERFELVFLDVYLPDASGLGGLGRLIQGLGAPEVVVITGKGDPESAREAINQGAWNYLEKPPDFDTIRVAVERVLEHRRLKPGKGSLAALKRGGIVGKSPALVKSLENLTKATAVRGNVFISGETGTGKELFARALHESSLPKDRPFVVVDCTSIPKTLAEAMLFGHTKGAYTDAAQEREGLFAMAHGGTLFLDEVGDLPADLQGSLLRVLQEKKFRPLGASREIQSEFRVVAVTNRDLPAMVEGKAFRQDLFFRLAQFRFTLPPLREREGDIPLLVDHYLTRFCSEQDIRIKTASAEFLVSLQSYHWPGNVRELVSVVAAALVIAGNEEVIYPQHLPKEYMADFVSRSVRRTRPRGETAPPETWDMAADRIMDQGAMPTLKEFRDQSAAVLEARYLDRLIQASGGDVAQALGLAGISRTRLYQLLRKHGRAMRP